MRAGSLHAVRDTTSIPALAFEVTSQRCDFSRCVVRKETGWLAAGGLAGVGNAHVHFWPATAAALTFVYTLRSSPMNGTAECQLTDGQVCEPPTGRKCVTTSSSCLKYGARLRRQGINVWSDARRQEAIQSVGGVSLPPPPLMPPSVTQRDPWSYRTCEAQGCALGPLCLKCACQCATNTIASLLSPTPTYQARSKDALPEATPEVLRRLFSCGVAGMCATSGCELTSTRTAFVRRI